MLLTQKCDYNINWQVQTLKHRRKSMAAKDGTEVKKKTSSQRQKEEEKREKTEKLNAQKVSLSSRLAAVEALRSRYSFPDLQGVDVEHTQYGPGKVVDQKESVLVIDYNGMNKKQKLPFVVANGFLHLEDPEMEKSFLQMDDLDRQMNALTKELQYINSLLSDLDKA